MAVLAGWLGLLWLVPSLRQHTAPLQDARLSWAVLAVVVTLGLIAAHDLYLARACSVRAVELQGLGRSVLGAATVLVVVEQLLDAEVLLRDVWIASFATFVLLASGRAGFTAWLQRRRATGHFVRDIVLVGADADAVELSAVLRDHPELGFRVRGYVGDPTYAARIGAPHLGTVDRAAEMVARTESTGALVVASALPPRTLNAVVRDLLARGVRIQLSSGIRGIAHQRFRATPLAYEPVFFIEPVSLRSWQWTVKRCADVCTAAVAICALAPLFAAIALLIRMDSSGPVLFRQRRVGRDGQFFTMLKFRTMSTDAEAKLPSLRSANERVDGPLFKLATDPRTTRVGRILRISSLDELPQLLNVLGGSMSLVGPRPALPHEAEQFDDQLKTRTRVMPGMTGLWQIKARDNPAFGPYRRLDLFYVENWSPLLDLWITGATFFHLVGRVARQLRRAATRNAVAAATPDSVHRPAAHTTIVLDPPRDDEPPAPVETSDQQRVGS